MEMSSKKSHIALDLLSRAQPTEDALTFFKAKVLDRPLYLKPTSAQEQQKTNARAVRQKLRIEKALKKRKSPGKPRPLSAKHKRALQIYNIPKSQRKYSIYLPLWSMWCGYIREILGITAEVKPGGYGQFVEPKGAGPLLAGADFHGALLEVVRSRCVGRVGIRGIVVRDTMFTFEVITSKDELKGEISTCSTLEMGCPNLVVVVVPKEHTVFRFEVPIVDVPLEKEDESKLGEGKVSEEEDTDMIGPKKDQLRPLVFELQGSNFETRATDRATRKFVLHLPPDL
jgi:ribonuclease P protein subunit POP4